MDSIDVSPDSFYEEVRRQKIDFFVGVPDSLLKYFCNYVADHCQSHLIAANEGGAVAIAVGHHLANGGIPLVYMQNSGLGNAVNPLLSLSHTKVYSIPMILLIGWRGEPGFKDEPQHTVTGAITLQLAELMDIKVFILEASSYKAQLFEAIQHAKVNSCPVALLVRRNFFSEYHGPSAILAQKSLAREDAIRECLNFIDQTSESMILSTTGMISRELYSIRHENFNRGGDFYNVGAMGLVSQIALGLAETSKHKQIFCFDGDGSVLMHLGSIAIIGASKSKNFCHIVFDNQSHDSVGGQPTATTQVKLEQIAQVCGYERVVRASTKTEIEIFFTKTYERDQGPYFLLIEVKKGSRKNLERPDLTLDEIKKKFRAKLAGDIQS